MNKLLLVDDHPIFLDGLKQFIETYDGFEVTCAKSADEAAAAMERNVFDLLILDLTIIGGGGLEILKSVRTSGSDVPIIFLTVHIKPHDTVEALKLGISGIILKESPPAEIMECIETVLADETSFDKKVTEKALQHSMENPSAPSSEDSDLTARELQIVDLVSRGLRNREIGEEFDLTEGTVKAHLHNIFSKIGVKSRTQLLFALGRLHRD